eukprot:12793137-Prorocentrum_lima.AAC.1
MFCHQWGPRKRLREKERRVTSSEAKPLSQRIQFSHFSQGHHPRIRPRSTRDWKASVRTFAAECCR